MKPKRKSPEKKAAAASRRAAPGNSRRTAERAGSRSAARPSTKEAGTPLSVPRKSRRKVTVTVPPILLEGDRPPSPVLGGPGQRYVLGPSAPVEQHEAEGELPEAYGTERLLLAARDPHWLYAHWDLNREQQLKYNSLSVDKHLVLRIKARMPELVPIAEVHVHPESRHWFVHVDQAGTTYIAELGYYSKNGRWTSISVSSPTFAPPDAVSTDTSVEFATIPIELPMSRLLALVKEALHQNEPLARALQELRAQGHPGLPAATAPDRPWTPAQERALAEVLSMDRVRRVWMGSLEITELIRRGAMRELASMAAAELSLPTSPGAAPGSVSSFQAGMPGPKGFWFNVNAELIVYGATESSATVTIGGRTIRLRPDGSFSYRFALPDGDYELPIVAVSADHTDGRAAEMKFQRQTDYRGEVGVHPQEATLKRPAAANL